MIFSSKIAGLEKDLATRTEELTAANADKAALQTRVDELDQANTDCKTQFDADQLTISTLTGERDQATAKVTDLTARLEKADKSVDAKVIEKIADAGVPPIARVIDTDATPTGAKPGSDKTLSVRQRLAASFTAAAKK